VWKNKALLFFLQLQPANKPVLTKLWTGSWLGMVLFLKVAVCCALQTSNRYSCDFRKNSCKLCFFAEMLAQNCGCSLYMRPFVHGLLNSQLGTSFSPINTVLMSRLPFVNHCIDNKQTFSCDWAKPDFHANFNFIISTVCFNNKTTVVSCTNSRNRLKTSF